MTAGTRATYVPGLLRVAELDGEAAALVRDAVVAGRLSEDALRDLVGRHALRGADLTLLVAHDILGRALADACRAAGVDERTGRRRLASARARLGAGEDAEDAVIGQWDVRVPQGGSRVPPGGSTERWATPSRVQQLRLFPTTARPDGEQPAGRVGQMKGGDDDGQGPAQAEDRGKARVAIQEGEPRP